MKSNLSRILLPMAAIVISSAMGLTVTNSAFAASAVAKVRPPVKTAAPAPVRPVEHISMSMQQFNRRVAVLPELASLQEGDLVTLGDNGSVTDAVWQGTFVFHPAGSKVPLGAMYARWKDGVVAISPTLSTVKVPRPGTLDASFVEAANGKTHQTIKTLINDYSASSVLRIPNNAWLLRADGNGQYTTLVDMFVFQSGNQPVALRRAANGSTVLLTGSQPVPISAGALNVN